MTTAAHILAMRRAFDERFALPRQAAVEALENIVVIGVGDERFALRLAELTAFVPLRGLAPIHGARPGVRGLVGVRGKLVPVFSLADALGVPDTATPAWLAVSGSASAPIGFAVSILHGQRPVPLDAIVEAGDLRRRFASRIVILDERPVPVLELPQLIHQLATSGEP